MTTTDPRAQAEQRMAIELHYAFNNAVPVRPSGGTLSTQELAACWNAAAKLAAEEIAKVAAVVGHDDRDDCWLGAPGYPPVPEGHVHPHPPRPVPWHLVCAEAEKGGKP